MKVIAMNTELTKIARAPALLAALLWCGLAAAADEGRPIDERRPLKPDARVSVHNVAGLIEVQAWDKNELHLTGTLADEVEELEITGDAASLDIEVRLPRHTRHTGSSDLRLKVPAGTRLEAEAVSADVTVRGLKGEVQAQSVSGDVTLDVGSAKVKAESVSGDVEVRAPAASASVQSVSGDVTISARGAVHGESVSGDVEVHARDVRELSVNSVSGDLILDLELAKGADVEAETLSGNVELILPGPPDATLEMETFSGSLRSTFSPGPGRGAKAYRHEGSGRGRVELHSHSGDIELKKR
jgi:DUF4097 and DUF4098 domain-containing protein YvlB